MELAKFKLHYYDLVRRARLYGVAGEEREANEEALATALLSKRPADERARGAANPAQTGLSRRPAPSHSSRLPFNHFV